VPEGHGESIGHRNHIAYNSFCPFCNIFS